MNRIFETISRENFKQSGYLTHPCSERRTVWKFSRPPRTLVHAGEDTVQATLQRRRQAKSHKPSIVSVLKESFNVFFRG